MKIVGLAGGQATPFDGEYLQDYDPDREGTDPEGNPMRCHLVTTRDVTEARLFASLQDLMACWKRQAKERPVRADGQPNRPLTAFTIEPVKV